MYADVDEKTGETLQITKPIPLPALNVRHSPESTCSVWNAKSLNLFWVVFAVRHAASQNVYSVCDVFFFNFKFELFAWTYFCFFLSVC